MFPQAADLLPLPPGLVAITGDEGTGKTTLLRAIAREVPSALWLDPALPGREQQLPQQVWEALRPSCPHWQPALQEDLVEALGLQGHLAKQLFMLSTGSRRKVALVGLLASGAAVTCLDQPYAALDKASIAAVRGFLADMADHEHRTWVVADYVADPGLPWRRRVALA